MADSIRKDNSLFANMSLLDQSITINLDEAFDKLAVNLIDQNENLTAGLSELMSGVIDVKVNGTSVVDRGIAYVTVPTRVSELENDAKYVVEEETGRYLIKREDIATGIITIELHTKSGRKLSEVSFTRIDYLAGACIGLQDRKINLLFDLEAFTVSEDNKLCINKDYVATKEYVDTELAKEIASRQAADSAINSAVSAVDQKIDQEALIRLEADTALNSAVQAVDQKLDTKIEAVTQELSIISTKVDNLSIIANQHEAHLSTLDNQVNSINLKLSEKVDKNLSLLPNANPNLSIESRENLLVYLYNTKDSVSSKAKLTELGYWDCENN